MEPKKTGFTLEQHEQFGIEIQTMHNRLQEISTDLSKHYRFTGNEGKPHKYVNQIIEIFRNLRSELERFACNDLGKNAVPDIKKIYY